MKIHNAGNTKKRSKKGLLTLGIAVAVVAALGASAYAGFKGGLAGLSFGKSSTEYPVVEDGQDSGTEGSQMPLPEVELISLQGYADSPEYNATAEWLRFEDSYDRDWQIMYAYDAECKRTGEDPFGEKYGTYGVYSQEMADKVDEITAKYNLELHTGFDDCNEQIFKAKYGKVFPEAFSGVGYMYDDGTFQMDSLCNGINFQIRRCMRGYFDTVYLNIGNAENYEEYEYKTKSGITVTISEGKAGQFQNKWIVTANLNDSFVSLNILPWDYDGNEKVYTKDQIEQLADQIDFSAL